MSIHYTNITLDSEKKHIVHLKCIKYLAPNIGNLSHLIRLKFWNVRINYLPNSMLRLTNLEHFEVVYCQSLKSIDKLCKLPKLKYIKIIECPNLKAPSKKFKCKIEA